MARRMPKSFFWIDQKLIRSGLWQKLTVTGKLFYVVLSAACDRDGRCHWGRTKLMELAGGTERDFESGMAELSGHRLVKMDDGLGAIELLALDEEPPLESPQPSLKAKTEATPVVIHTQLTVQLGKPC